MLVVALALLAALAYGLADFVGGAASKRTSPWAVVLVAQVAGAVAVLLLALAVDGAPRSADMGWAVVGGACNGVGTMFLYRGLANGRMGVVAPVSGVGAAALPVVVGLIAGERPSTLVWVGIGAALPGIWLVSREPGGTPRVPGGPGGSGLVDGVLAGLGFGGLFACLAQIPEEAGFLPLAVNQVVAAVAVVAVAAAVRAPWVPREPAAALGAVGGVLAAVATGSFLLATQTGFLTVAAVLTSLYPAVTVVLAATLLRERVHRGQAWGLVLCLTAVGLVAAG
jgi:drug/metabolite transporter (DMT)-like permease